MALPRTPSLLFVGMIVLFVSCTTNCLAKSPPQDDKPRLLASPVGKPGHEVSKAFDGNPKTSFRPIKKGPGPWIQVRFNRVQEFDAFVMRYVTESGYGVPREYAIQFKKGRRWKTAATIKENFSNIDRIRFRAGKSKVWRIRVDRLVKTNSTWSPVAISFTYLGDKKFEPQADAKVDQLDVNKAIDKGMAFLLEKWKKDGKFPSGYNPQYPMGAMALGALALRKSGLTRKDPVILDLVNRLSKLTPKKTYGVGLYAMFLRSVSKKKYSKKLQELADWLVKNQSSEGLWGYPTGKADVSNTQYALLGLKAAVEGGATVPNSVFRKSWDWFLKNPEPVGGFRYEPLRQPKHDPVTGSMTAAALACLKICANHFPHDRGRLRTSKKICDAALHWLGENFVAETNPGSGRWHYYYLYGIERVGAYFKIRKLGSKPWYATGARHLLDFQQKNGAWKSNYFEETCFALLFLNRASTTGSESK